MGGESTRERKSEKAGIARLRAELARVTEELPLLREIEKAARRRQQEERANAEEPCQVGATDCPGCALDEALAAADRARAKAQGQDAGEVRDE